MAAVSPSRVLEVRSTLYFPPSRFSLVTEDQRKAASKIFSAWRRSTATLDFLRKGVMDISRVSHTGFWKQCMPRLGPLLQESPTEVSPNAKRHALRKTFIRKACAELVEKRKDVQEMSFVPVCTVIKGGGNLPEYYLVSKAELPFGGEWFGSVYCARKEIVKAPISEVPLTRGHLDSLVQKLSCQTDVFPWNFNTDGCAMRADIMIEFLVLSGISIEHIKKQYLLIPADFNRYGWRYHVAPVIGLPDGSVWVIDPSLDRNRALSIEAWGGQQLKDVAELPEDFNIHDRGFITVDGPLTWNQTREGIMLSAPVEARLIDDGINKDSPDFRLSMRRTDEERDGDLKTLASYRSQLEEPFIDDLLRPIRENLQSSNDQ